MFLGLPPCSATYSCVRGSACPPSRSRDRRRACPPRAWRGDHYADDRPERVDLPALLPGRVAELTRVRYPPTPPPQHSGLALSIEAPFGSWARIPTAALVGRPLVSVMVYLRLLWFCYTR